MKNMNQPFFSNTHKREILFFQNLLQIPQFRFSHEISLPEKQPSHFSRIVYSLLLCDFTVHMKKHVKTHALITNFIKKNISTNIVAVEKLER